MCCIFLVLTVSESVGYGQFTSHNGSRKPFINAPGLKRAFLSAWYKWKLSRLYSAISSLIRGRRTRLKNRWAIFSLRFDVNIRVAWYMAAALQDVGSGIVCNKQKTPTVLDRPAVCQTSLKCTYSIPVTYRTCSQLQRFGMILKAFGSLPPRYFERTSRTPSYICLTLGSKSWICKPLTKYQEWNSLHCLKNVQNSVNPFCNTCFNTGISWVTRYNVKL